MTTSTAPTAAQTLAPEATPTLSEGSTAQIVPVVYDPDAGSLEILAEDVVLHTGESIVWQFFGIPQDWLPGLSFGTEDRYGLGPFAALRKTTDQIWGQGNAGLAEGTSSESLEYRATIYMTDGSAVVTSDPAHLVNLGDAASNPKVYVEVDLAAGNFRIEPERFSCFDGDTVSFEFFNLPSNYAPELIFNQYRPFDSTDWASSPGLGPFTSFCREGRTIVGAGTSGAYGVYHFYVAITDLTRGDLTPRKLERSGDPVIDHEEDPIYE